MAAIALAGSVAQRPGHAGHAWVFLNYLLGLRRLGHEVTFVDRLTPEMLGATGDGGELARSAEAEWLRAVMTAAGFGDDCFLLSSDDGATRNRLLKRLRRTDLLIDVNGFLADDELLGAPEQTAFLDIDPAIQQMWVDLGLADLFGSHDLYFTFGENLGKAGCAVPTCGHDWLPTRPPVVLEEWPATGSGSSFTTVASWRGPYGSIEYQGQTYGLRVHEFRHFASLPSLVEAECSIALDVDSADGEDIAALERAGWNLLDPRAVAGDPGAYRSFVQSSRAEVAIAKNVYVRSRCGWFSDRSACYLASGKPVLAQETGFAANLPTGLGLLAFEDLDGAVAGVEAIEADWERHAMAARNIAREFFDSDKVLGGMLDAVGI